MGDLSLAVAKQSSSSTVAEPAHTPAPAPKAEAEWTGQRIPKPEDIIAPKKPALGGASRSVLDTAITAYTAAIYKDLHNALKGAGAALSEPPRPPDQTFANKVMGFLVRNLTELAITYVSGGILAAAKPLIGEVAFQAFKGVVTFGARSGGEAARDAVTTKAPGATRYVPGGEHHLVDLSATTLVQEFLAEQERALNLREADVAVMVAMLAAVPDVDPAKVVELADQLREKANRDSTVSSDFMRMITIGWMNLCATLALGEQKEGEPAFQGANEPGGIRAAQQHGDTSFIGGQDGFINIEIDVPDHLWGTNGFQLSSMTTTDNTTEGAARILRSQPQPILATAVYRRVWLGKRGQGLLAWDPVLIISPDGSLHVDVDQPLLAAIGRMVPIDFETTGAMPRGRDFTRDAHLGASMVMSWLGHLTTEKLR